MERTKRVSEVARELGVSERWLRESERNGKIPIAHRDLNNWRKYTKEDVKALRRLLVPQQREAKVS
jgi:DNA-binding transcriptional MerR regulator